MRWLERAECCFDEFGPIDSKFLGCITQKSSTAELIDPATEHLDKRFSALSEWERCCIIRAIVQGFSWMDGQLQYVGEFPDRTWRKQQYG